MTILPISDRIVKGIERLIHHISRLGYNNTPRNLCNFGRCRGVFLNPEGRRCRLIICNRKNADEKTPYDDNGS
ncbi:hypothetical protein IH992_11855 [Candidatus Poribacteria bacterium]|nr:hypothetical protein [Candidatus Poribacteria bacterium]